MTLEILISFVARYGSTVQHCGTEKLHTIDVVASMLDQLFDTALTIDDWANSTTLLMQFHEGRQFSSAKTQPAASRTSDTDAESCASFASGTAAATPINTANKRARTSEFTGDEDECDLRARNKDLEAQLELQANTIHHQSQQLEEKDAQIHNLRAIQRSLHQKNRRLRTHAEKLEQAAAETRKSDALDIKRVQDSSKNDNANWSWLTPQGVVSLALRRNLSNIAQSDIGYVILDDVSQWTVSRCEVKTGAALIASARLWFNQLAHDIFSTKASGYSTSVIASRQDATHGRNKVAAMELQAVSHLFQGHQQGWVPVVKPLGLTVGTAVRLFVWRIS